MFMIFEKKKKFSSNSMAQNENTEIYKILKICVFYFLYFY